jgi:excisionase family DNA binding protein
MFYTTDEAAQKLGVSGDALKGLVAQNKLREFRDGARVMFKVDQVDKLVADKGKSQAGEPGLSDSGIALAGPGSSGTDVISLADTGAGSLNSKEDTVVTGQGVSVFDKSEVKSPADSAAQTQIQSAIDDQLSLEGVGSGSGLLDLTRESDDTSLGAELLDEIYPGGEKKGDSGIASSSGIFEQTAETSGPSGLEHMATAPAPVAVEAVEARDPMSGAFGGMAIASVIIMALTGTISLAILQGYSPAWLVSIYTASNGVMMFSIVLVVIAVLFAFVGLFVGKAAR